MGSGFARAAQGAWSVGGDPRTLGTQNGGLSNTRSICLKPTGISSSRFFDPMVTGTGYTLCKFESIVDRLTFIVNYNDQPIKGVVLRVDSDIFTNTERSTVLISAVLVEGFVKVNMIDAINNFTLDFSIAKDLNVNSIGLVSLGRILQNGLGSQSESLNLNKTAEVAAVRLSSSRPGIPMSMPCRSKSVKCW